MKIIDILVKIANDEALPEKIRFENHIYYAYHYENRIIDYYYTDELKNQITLFEDSMRNYGITSYLNDEVEIIEDTNEITAKNHFNTLKDTSKEEKKIPEKVDFDIFNFVYKEYELNIMRNNVIANTKAINEIIDYLDYFKSKGE